MTLSPNGKYLLSGGDDGLVKVWLCEALGSRVPAVQVCVPAAVRGNSSSCVVFCLYVHGTAIVVVLFYQAFSGHLKRAMGGVFSSDGQLVVTISPGVDVFFSAFQDFFRLVFPPLTNL